MKGRSYRWKAIMSDNHILRQNGDDFSGYNESILDYSNKTMATLAVFCFGDSSVDYSVHMDREKPLITYDEINRYGFLTKHCELAKSKRQLKDCVPVLESSADKNGIEAYKVGFSGIEKNGRQYKKTVTVV